MILHSHFNRMRSKLMPNSTDRLVAAATDFREELDLLKASNPPEGFTWYGYNTLSALHHFPKLFPGELGSFFDTIQGPIADIGGADGELAFLLEKQGFKAELIDYPATNWNGLQGAYRLKELLRSKVEIHEIDLDSQFSLPNKNYDLIIFLGILYHLKNPFYALEQLAHRTRRLILSTRIAKRTADGKTILEDAPVAYLVGPRECNNDPTNYWIFSKAGLKQIVNRTGWDIRVMYTVGDIEASNPSELEHDERAWLTLESRHLRKL